MTLLGLHDEYVLAEKENDNLRAILRWCLPRIPEAERADLARMIEAQIEDGGVVPDVHEDNETTIRDREILLGKIADHFEGFIANGVPVSGKDADAKWFAAGCRLIEAAREVEWPRQAPKITLSDIRELAARKHGDSQ